MGKYRMKVVLDYKIPVLTYTPPVDCKTAILWNTEDEIQNSLWEHFIRIKNSKYVKNVDFVDSNVWGGFKNLSLYKISKKLILKDPWEILSEYIGEGYYLFLNTDSSQISEYVNFGSVKYRHELLIYGYDDSIGKIYAADYFDFKRYQKRMLDFEEVRKAIQSSLDIDDDYLEGVYCLKAVKIPEHFRRVKKRYDWYKMYGDLISLITPVKDENMHGFYYFTMLKQEVERNGTTVPIRPFHFIEVHAFFMKHRLTYLKRIGYDLVQDSIYMLDEIIKKSYILKRMHLKNIVKNTRQMDVKLVELHMIEDVERLYTCFVLQIIENIEKKIFKKI